MPKQIKRKRVALLVSAWNHYGRGIIEGAWNYAQNNFWNLDMQPSGPDGGMRAGHCPAQQGGKRRRQHDAVDPGLVVLHAVDQQLLHLDEGVLRRVVVGHHL